MSASESAWRFAMTAWQHSAQDSNCYQGKRHRPTKPKPGWGRTEGEERGERRKGKKEGRQEGGSRRLTHQESCECDHCVGFRLPRTIIFGTFWLLGAPVPTPYYLWGPCYSRPTVHVYVSKIVSMGFFYRPLAAKKQTIFSVFWTSAFSDVDSWRQSGKVEHRCTTTNSIHQTASKSFLYYEAFMAKSGTQTLMFKSVTDKQKKLDFFRCPNGGWNLSPINLDGFENSDVQWRTHMCLNSHIIVIELFWDICIVRDESSLISVDQATVDLKVSCLGLKDKFL